MNHLAENYPGEVEKILAKYPDGQKRSAAMPLLYLAQREQGYVTKQSLQDIAELAGISATDVASLVGFYTLFHGQPAGKRRIQVCNDLPCALRGADQFLAALCENLGIQVGETTPDGLVTVEAVMCLAGCDKAPLFQAQTGEGLDYYENQTVESALKLVEQWRAEEKSRQEVVPLSGEPAEPSLAVIAEKGSSSISEKERIKVQREGGQ